jgi:hypothetical protein
MTDRPKPADLSQIRTYSIRSRPTKVDHTVLAKVPNIHQPMGEFFEALPGVLKAKELLLASQRVAEARLHDKGIILMMGAHVIKCGLSPIIIRMMEERLITCICMNGAAALAFRSTCSLPWERTRSTSIRPATERLSGKAQCVTSGGWPASFPHWIREAS